MVLYPFFIDCSVKGDPKIGIIFRMRKTAGGCRGWTRLSGINVYLCCGNPPVCGFAGGESGASFTEFDDADNQTCPGRRTREEVHQAVEQVARHLVIEAEQRRVSAQMLALIVIDITERKAADELRLVTSLEIFVLEMIQEILPIDIPHIDHVDIDRTQRIARILQIAPRISPSHAGKGTPIIRAILEIDAEFEPGPGHLDRLPPLGSERQQETGKLQTHIDSEFDGVALAGTRSFHILVPYRERNVERLRSPENIAVLIQNRD